MIPPGKLLRGEGSINRQTFLLAGIALALLKQTIDLGLLVALNRGAMPLAFNYWVPLGHWVALDSLGGTDVKFLLTLVAVAIPFIWMGVCLTLARLRDAGLPLWMALNFFLPFLNMLFFVFLCCAPTASPAAAVGLSTARHQRSLDRWIPASAAGSAFAGAMLTLVLGLLLVGFATKVLLDYGWGLFVGVPFLMGFLSVMVYCYHEPRSYRSCIGVACLSPMLLGLGLLAYAIEGIICLLMAAPLALLLALMGGSFAYWLQPSRHASPAAPAIAGMLLVVLPMGMSLEHWIAPAPPVFAVTTSVEVDAPPEVVWPNVIAFAELPPPSELLFRVGVAYPMRAEIVGSGPGAVRQCVFSTGAFTEPIQVWDAPRLLKFSVASNPAPLAEWTPYERVTPPHLRGFLVSQGGQFRLVPLPGGHTLLEGTTWYRHSMWPAAYWKLWSDHIIHEIHLRVLHYIAARSVVR